MSIQPALLPLFPLNLLPLPGETIALHIFEGRYQLLFDQLEEMEVDEFGIPFVDGNKRTNLGGLMRLVFVSEPDENGFRNAAVQCIGLFQLHSFQAKPDDEECPYPMGDVDRWYDWKNWTLSDLASTYFDKTSSLASQDAKSLRKEPSNPGLISAMVHHKISPKKRFEILSSANELKRNERMENAARFAFLIAEQEAHLNTGYFPN